MLLCDSAQEAGGKLFVLGGGWSVARGPRVNMGLAIKISVPWHSANQELPLLIVLMTEDGTPVLVDGKEIKVEGTVEVGRPPGVRAGSSLDAPMAMNLHGVPLSPGGYRWELSIDGELRATQSFQVQA